MCSAVDVWGKWAGRDCLVCCVDVFQYVLHVFKVVEFVCAVHLFDMIS